MHAMALVCIMFTKSNYYLMKHKEVLIKYDLVSKEGYNNARFPLWKNYDFDKFLTEENDERREWCNTIYKQLNDLNEQLAQHARYTENK